APGRVVVVPQAAARGHDGVQAIVAAVQVHDHEVPTAERLRERAAQKGMPEETRTEETAGGDDAAPLDELSSRDRHAVLLPPLSAADMPATASPARTGRSASCFACRSRTSRGRRSVHRDT